MNFNQTPRMVIALMRAAEQSTGVPIPPAVLAAVDHGTDLVTRASTLQADPEGLADAVTAALDAGRDPRTDKAVQAHLTAEQLAGRDIARLINERAETATGRALHDAGPDYLTALGNVADKAGQQLTTAARTLPTATDLNDPASAAGLNPEQAATWATARGALSRLDTIANVWGALVNVTHLANYNPQERALVFANLTADDLDDLDGGRATFWAIVEAGHPIELATPATYRQRVTGVADAREQAWATAKREFANAISGRRDNLAAILNR